MGRQRGGACGSGAARLAAIPAGAGPANKRSPVHVVVISSGSEGDQTAGSLEVKALWGDGDLLALNPFRDIPIVTPAAFVQGVAR